MTQAAFHFFRCHAIGFYGQGPARQDDILADEQMTVSEKDGILDLSWFIYETAALAIPIKHVHAPGKCNSEMMNVIKEHSVTERDGEDSEEQIDPRWSGLLKLTASRTSAKRQDSTSPTA